jgi:hypothetical protein
MDETLVYSWPIPVCFYLWDRPTLEPVPRADSLLSSHIRSWLPLSSWIYVSQHFQSHLCSERMNNGSAVSQTIKSRLKNATSCFPVINLNVPHQYCNIKNYSSTYFFSEIVSYALNGIFAHCILEGKFVLITNDDNLTLHGIGMINFALSGDLHGI